MQDAEAARLQQTRRLLAERSLRRFMSLPARVSLSAVPDPVTASVTPLAAPAAHTPGDGSDGGSDEKRCETPCILTMPAGRYRLNMTREGYFPEQVEFEARVGQALLISRQLRPRPRRVLIESTPQRRAGTVVKAARASASVKPRSRARRRFFRKFLRSSRP